MFSNLKTGEGLKAIVAFIERAGLPRTEGTSRPWGGAVAAQRPAPSETSAAMNNSQITT